jgi:NADH-quinone oxidoreductase subunit J
MTAVLASGLAVLLDIDAFAMLLIVIYVGAVAVLFLFVVMMLDLGHQAPGLTLEGWKHAMLLATFLAASGVTAYHKENPPVGDLWSIEGIEVPHFWSAFADGQGSGGNLLAAIGNTLYTVYTVQFLLASGALLVAMMGAITATMSKKASTKHQIASKQISQEASLAIKLAKATKAKSVLG